MSEQLLLPRRFAPALLELGPTLADEPESLTPVDVAELGESVVGTATPWYTDLESELARLEVDAEARVARADRFLDAYRGHPWIAPLGDGLQVEGRAPIGYWGPHRGVWTTTQVAGFRPARLDPSPNWRQHVWGYRVRPEARVHELRGPDDWLELIRRHPQLVSTEPFVFPSSDWSLPAPFYLPDFDAFAGDWDALRISLWGAVGAANLVLEVLDGYTFIVHEDFAEET